MKNYMSSMNLRLNNSNKHLSNSNSFFLISISWQNNLQQEHINFSSTSSQYYRMYRKSSQYTYNMRSGTLSINYLSYFYKCSMDNFIHIARNSNNTLISNLYRLFHLCIMYILLNNLSIITEYSNIDQFSIQPSIKLWFDLNQFPMDMIYTNLNLCMLNTSYYIDCRYPLLLLDNNRHYNC